MIENKRMILVERPGDNYFDNPGKVFKVDIEKINSNEIPEGMVLVETHYVSIDPTMRVWMSGIRTYMGVLELNSVMPAMAVGKVIKSNLKGFEAGDIVMGMMGWQQYALQDKKMIFKIPKEYPQPSHFLGIYGINGLTAYFGLNEIGKPKAGETVVVSTAAGSVGSVAIQLAKNLGCRVVGIAGGEDKCKFVKEKLGADECIDYKKFNSDWNALSEALKKACPKGIDVYFDNVGGWQLDAVFRLINNYSRIVACGAIAGYNSKTAEQDSTVLRNYGNVIMRRATYQGFIYFDYQKKFMQATQELMGLMQDGKIYFQEDITEGLENAPLALKKLFTGKNTGKTLVKLQVSPKPSL